jgi:hypothetical protein
VLTITGILDKTYVLALPQDNQVLHSTELGAFYTTYCGDLSSFVNQHYEENTIHIMDWHTAYCLNWVDEETMYKNMPYLTEQVRAALALITWEK